MKIKKESILYGVLILIIGITIISMIFIFDYGDLDALTAWSVNLLDAIADGNLMNYYSYTVHSIRGASEAVFSGSFIDEIPLAIWNIPLWITHPRNVNPIVTTQMCLVWVKLLYLVFMFLTVHYIYRICCLFPNAIHNKIATFLLVFGSAELLISCIYAGQNEILFECFFIMSLYYYFVEKKINFWICSIISVSLCPIMIIPFIILIVSREKKIFRIILYCFIPFIPSIVFSVIYSSNDFYSETSGTWETGMLDGFLNNIKMNSNIKDTPYSVIILLFLACFMISYFSCSKEKRDDTDKTKIIAIVTTTMIIFNFFAKDNFYRSFLYMPLLILLVMVNNHNLNLCAFLIMLLNGFRTMTTLHIDSNRNMNTKFIMDKNYIDLFARHLGNDNDSCLYNCLNGTFSWFKTFFSFGMTFSLFAVMFILFITCRKDHKEYQFYVPARVSMSIYMMVMPLLMVMFTVMVHYTM